MARFRKDVLVPGTYSVPGPDGKSRRKVSYTSSDIKHLQSRLNEMMAAGIHVPASWEHQDLAKPADRLAQKAKNTLGFAEAAIIDESGKLVFDLDVPNDDDAKRLPSVRYVSPEIVEDWEDGTGRVWPGKSITHVAVTARPVQHAQQPFQRLSIVRLSLADRLGENVADEKEDKDGGEKGGSGDMKKILESLATLGVSLPDDTTMDNLCDRLIGAAAAKGGGDMPPAEEPAEVTEVGGGAGPVAMSLQNRLIKMEREGLTRRIKSLKDSGRIGKPIADKLAAQVKTVRLSLGKDGELSPTTLLAQIEAYEALPPSRYVSDQLSQAREVEEPDWRKQAPLTDKETDEAVKQWDTAMGRK